MTVSCMHGETITTNKLLVVFVFLLFRSFSAIESKDVSLVEASVTITNFQVYYVEITHNSV